MHVVKNSFLKRAMTDSGLPDVGDKLTGQTAVVTGEKDVAPVAKILKTFAAEFKIAALKIGVVDRAIFSTAELERWRNCRRAKFYCRNCSACSLSPATKLVRLLNEPASALARLLKAKAEKEGNNRRQASGIKIFPPRKVAGRGSETENCPGRWLSALIFRRLSEAAIGGK